MYRPEIDTDDHKHAYGKPYHSRFSGNYVRECPECGLVLAMWQDDDDDD